jgi:signal peptidase I
VTRSSSAEPADAPAPDDDNGGGTFSAVRSVVETLVLTLIIFVVVQTFVAQPFEVRQDSMEQSFEPGQYVLVDKLSPRWSSFGRGDVVVFKPPAASGEGASGVPFIKRVVGLPGETVEVKADGRVYIDGKALDEAYTYHDASGRNEPTTATSDEDRWVIPPGELFVMGDHRQVSVDSRVFGPIEIGSVVGRAVLRYWPLSALGIPPTPTYGSGG